MDSSDLYKLSRDCENIAIQIEQLADSLAKARVVKEYDGDRRKNLLAQFANAVVGESATKAETMARSNPEFEKAFKALSQELMSAHVVIAKHGGLQARLEAACSVLAVARAQMAL